MLTVAFKLECKLNVISCLASSFVHKNSEMGSDRNVNQSIPEWQTVSSFIEQPNLGLATSQVVRATRSYAAAEWAPKPDGACPCLKHTWHTSIC